MVTYYHRGYHDMTGLRAKAGIALTIVLVLLSVVATAGYAASETDPPRPIRVGVTANYPPMIFKQNNQIVGLEADFARMLGARFNRPVQFVEVAWEEQIPALLSGKTDMIMSAMSITDVRRIRIDFTEPYLRSGLSVAMRLGDAAKYPSLKAMQEPALAVGVIKGTTGEVYTKQNFRRASRLVPLTQAADAPDDLKGRRIDIFIYDAPSIAWLVSENEADLTMLRQLINEEYLAWGIRRTDQEFGAALNAAVGEWRGDGTLERVILKWLPYWRSLKE
jgi:ABC-type amino acid transport substrate-binding protein